MLDASDFRALAEPTYQTLNGRMSPPGFATAVQANNYATLTPLQPLPPISTMSDKFSHYGHPGSNGGFALMQNNLSMSHMNSYHHQYDKLGMNMNPALAAANTHHMMSAANGLGGHHHQQGGIPSPPYSQNGLHSPEKNMSPNAYDSYAHRDLTRGLVSPQSPSVSLHSPTSMMSSLNGLGQNGHHHHHQLSMSQSGRTLDVKPTTLSAPTPVPPSVSLSGAAPVQTPTPAGIPLTQPNPPIQASVPNSMNPAIMSVGHTNGNGHLGLGGHHAKLASMHGGPGGQKMNSSSAAAEEVEEINTKELAQRISAELKRYSIPQAIFAQRVLCRSQGTLSDLLRNPKPWSKLKSGRETFRRMYKWLEEPEFQRMSALRLAGKSFSPCWFSNDNNYGTTNNSKRVHPPVPGFQYQMRNEHQRAGPGRSQRRGLYRHLQAERRTTSSAASAAAAAALGKEPQHAQEAALGLYRPAAPHVAGHF